MSVGLGVGRFPTLILLRMHQRRTGSNAPEAHRLKLTLLKAGILSRLFNCYYWKVAASFFNNGSKISVRARLSVGKSPTLIFLRMLQRRTSLTCALEAYHST